LLFLSFLIKRKVLKNKSLIKGGFYGGEAPTELWARKADRLEK